MVNPYEPTVHTSGRNREDWLFAVVTFVFVMCLLIAVTDILSLAVPATRAFLRPRFGFSTLFINPLIFLWIWYRQRDNRTLRGAVFILIVLAIINAVMLLWKGTVSVVTNPFVDSLHSAWLYAVLPPLVLAALLAVFLVLDSRSRAP